MPEGTSGLGLGVVMSVLAVFAAELFVSPSITYLAAALKADRHPSYVLLILHTANLSHIFLIYNSLSKVFLFLMQIKLFLSSSKDIKKILCRIKKIQKG